MTLAPTFHIDPHRASAGPARLTRRPREPRFALRYPILGAALAVGSPVGLLVVRWITGGFGSMSPWVAGEIRDDLVTYVYLLLSTTIVFVTVGRALGRQADELRATSMTDALTGLASRRRAESRIAESLRLAKRYDAPLSLLLLDVDRLKDINDRGGHAAGDTALRAVARALRGTARETDVAARWGGDEFALVAPMTNAMQAAELGERVRAALGKSRRTAGFHVVPSVSIGIADLAATEDLSVDALCRAADRALYEAKHLGRDRVSLAPGTGHPAPQTLLVP